MQLVAFISLQSCCTNGFRIDCCWELESLRQWRKIVPGSCCDVGEGSFGELERCIGVVYGFTLACIDLPYILRQIAIETFTSGSWTRRIRRYTTCYILPRFKTFSVTYLLVSVRRCYLLTGFWHETRLWSTARRWLSAANSDRRRFFSPFSIWLLLN